ncbi:MAG: cupin domain-containing protein [Saprospiraceae bacterium]
MILSKQNTTHYFWGEKCNGWHFVQSHDLHIIEELMPPNTSETKHYHHIAQQFFYILKGVATFEIEAETYEIQTREGVHILPNIRHQIKNLTDQNLEFLVISNPTTRGDRSENLSFAHRVLGTSERQKKQKKINLNGKKFKALYNSGNGEVREETIFSYRQKDDIVWATYEGGSIKFGTLSGQIIDNQLVFNYQHQNMEGEFLTGKCETAIKIIDNQIQLHETWQWTCRDFSSGSSILVEISSL